MRGSRTRSVVVAVALGVVLAMPAPAAAASTRSVSGTMTGPGGFRFDGCGGIITQVGSGSFEASGLGRGTYTFRVCVISVSPITFEGTVRFTTNSGATLDGTIGNTNATQPRFEVTLTGGTKRFKRVAGQLIIGPLVQSNPTNCDPRVNICLDWTDNGPLTGELGRVRGR